MLPVLIGALTETVVSLRVLDMTQNAFDSTLMRSENRKRRATKTAVKAKRRATKKAKKIKRSGRR